MDGKIYRLPEAVINQIAAGEVVENPASIVKELIENSLDAGATSIRVEIVSGGQQLIRIEDDGCGMGREDAVLSLERHATSKIRAVEDLSTLMTMGFRGEALAAIAAVSQFELKTKGEGEAVRVVASGGQLVTVEPCARNRGTTIEVRSLFFNVPARKKFQKSPSTNGTQVARVMETIALAHPEVAFSLVSAGKQVFEVEPADWKKRIEAFLEPHLHELEFEKGGIRVWGTVAAPLKAGATRSGQYLFINRRPIFSPLIARAVKEGFGTRIGEHAYPPFVLFLEMPSTLVDVNVHPQKKEVRFQEDAAMFQCVQEAVGSLFVSIPSFAEPLAFTPPPLSFAFAEQVLARRSTEQFQEVPLPIVFSERVVTVFGPYLLLEKEGLFCVDLRAAHARILFETLSQKKRVAEPLLWPLEVAVEGAEEETVHALSEMGIECRVVGRKRLAIDALPSFLDAASFAQFFSGWKEGKQLKMVTLEYCQGLKKRYSLTEAHGLWRRLQECEDRTYDPLGRPIWSEVKESDFAGIIRGGK